MGCVFPGAAYPQRTRITDMQTNPVSPVPVPSLSHLSHLHFIPKILEGDSAMDIDGAITSSGRYLVVGAVQFGNCEWSFLNIFPIIHNRARQLCPRNFDSSPFAPERDRTLSKFQMDHTSQIHAGVWWPRRFGDVYCETYLR